MSKINSSVNSISENFNNMAYSDSVTQKNLKDVYSTEADKTKSTLNSTFETLKSKKCKGEIDKIVIQVKI